MKAAAMNKHVEWRLSRPQSKQPSLDHSTVPGEPFFWSRRGNPARSSGVFVCLKFFRTKISVRTKHVGIMCLVGGGLGWTVILGSGHKLHGNGKPQGTSPVPPSSQPGC